MDKGLMELVMNPVRQRIIQCVALNGAVTTGQLQEELVDVPKASLYRHVKLLHEGGLLEVISETKIRGTIQREYRLTRAPLDGNSLNESSAAVYNVLMSLINSFRRYFREPDCDPSADMIFTEPHKLMLTDEEYQRLCSDIRSLINTAAAGQPAEGSKPRQLTIVSSPCEHNN